MTHVYARHTYTPENKRTVVWFSLALPASNMRHIERAELSLKSHRMTGKPEIKFVTYIRQFLGNGNYRLVVIVLVFNYTTALL